MAGSSPAMTGQDEIPGGTERFSGGFEGERPAWRAYGGRVELDAKATRRGIKTGRARGGREAEVVASYWTISARLSRPAKARSR
jgi:hypothetical protein